MDQSRLQYLFQVQLGKTISEEERVELYQFLQDGQNEAFVKEHIADIYSSGAEQFKMDAEVADKILDIILNTEKKAAKVRRMQPWVKWVAAAVVILMIAGGWWMVAGRKWQGTSSKTEVAKVNDVAAPKSTRAMITLADGTKLYLDSVGSGVLAQQNDVNVVKDANGQISYRLQGTGTKEGDASTPLSMTYNTAFNPRGSRVLPLMLNDGTKVWLNSESSLKYPVAFIGNERKVEITGEAYFEVKHDASKPFIVSKGETSVTVLGTHFNVNAYDDEESLKVTLLEGSVRVGIGNSELGIGKGKQVTIRPGEQAVVGIRNLELGIRKDIDVDEVMAWKNGKFQFTDVPIDAIMRQAARWYDVDVVYQGTVKKTFKGEIPRSVNASELFEILESTGLVHFKIEGKKVTVMPQEKK